MKNKEKVKVEIVEQKQCKGYHCTKLLPYGDKHLLCENCRGTYADGIKKGGKIALGVASVAVTIVTAGKVNIKKN